MSRSLRYSSELGRRRMVDFYRKIVDLPLPEKLQEPIKTFFKMIWSHVWCSSPWNTP
jgi:hypothetical protein